MKLHFVRKALIALSLVGMATTFGGQSATAATVSEPLTVTAEVEPSCTVSTTSVTFPAYDPLNTHTPGNPADGSGGVTVTCANGLSVVVRLGQSTPAVAGSTDDSPTREMTGPSATDKLDYNLYTDVPRADVWGNSAISGVSSLGTGLPVSLPIYARIPGGQNVNAGTYGDTVSATVEF